jgi:hypothetical protein
MKTTFQVRDRQYELSLDKRERAEGEKFNPFEITVSGQTDGAVTGTVQFTDDTLKDAEEQASSEGTTADALLAQASARALSAELVIRKLKPGFSFIVDHRWLHPSVVGARQP